MRILVVDDDSVFLDKMEKILTLSQYTVETAISAEDALSQLDNLKYDLILTDLKMPGLSGIDLIKKTKEMGIDSIVMVLTGYGTIQTAVEAMKIGAFDYVLKPFEMTSLISKIEEVEAELNLRKTLTITKKVEPQENGEFLEFKSISEYQSPFLVMSVHDPNEIITNFKIKRAIPINLKYEQEKDCIPPTKLHSLKSRIEEFVNHNSTGTIIFQGIEDLLIAHNWEHIKQFILYLQSEIITTKFNLIFLLNNKHDLIKKSHQSLLYDSLSLLVFPVFNKIITILSHSLRKNIITLLKAEPNLNYNKILHKLNEERSSVLAFHINKLLKEGIIDKKNNLYSLSPKGHYFAEIIFQIENLGFSYPNSQIKIFKMEQV